MTLVTKRGDDGNTDLWFADRVPKYHPQVEAYGALSEAQGALGLARALAPDWLKPEVLRIQKELFTASSELATLRGKAGRLSERIGPGHVARAEEGVARYERLIELRGWTLSGDSAGGAALDLALVLLRRGERWTVRLRDEGYVDNPDLLVWLNRLSDLLFLMARAVDRGVEVPAEEGGEK